VNNTVTKKGSITK